MSENTKNISAFIAENFGANASYVEGLLERFQADPKSVDESWQAYFGELLNGGSPEVEAKPVAAQPAAPVTQSAPAPPQPKATTVPSGSEAKALTGASKKIVNV